MNSAARGGVRLELFAFFALALVGGLVVFRAATPYPGVTVDSGEYLSVAEGLVNGHGFTMPYVNYDERFRILEPGERVAMTQFPPLYPALLAAVHGAGATSVLAAARFLGAALYAVNLLLAQLVVWRCTGSLVLALLTGLLLFVPGVLIPHAMAWSEPLLITALLGALLALSLYLERGGAGWAVTAAGAAAAAGLARFAGIAVAVCVAYLAARGRSNRRGVSLVLLTLSLAPVAAWFVRNALIAGSPSEKGLGLYLPGARHWVQGLQTLGSWLVPNPVLAYAAGVCLVVAGLVLLPVAFRALRSPPTTLARVVLVFALGYLAFVLASRILLDQNIPLDPRILAPLQVLAVVGFCAAFGAPGHTYRQRLLLGVIALLAAASVARGLNIAGDFSRLTVTGYTNETWRSSPTLRFAGALPSDALIITNAPDPIWLWHGRVSQLLPPRSSLYSGRPNENYSRQLRRMWRATACTDSFVVFFERPTRKPERTIDPLVVEGLELREIRRFDDGAAYDVDEPRELCPAGVRGGKEKEPGAFAPGSAENSE